MTIISDLINRRRKNFGLARDIRNKIAREFNARFYLKQNSDIAHLRVDPLEHYLEFGLLEDRQPRGDFSPIYYRRLYSAELSGQAPFIHWITVGRDKGYLGHPWQNDPDLDDIALMRAEFDPEFYARSNPDVVRAGGDLFEHFQKFGWLERRDPNESFSIETYLRWYPELRLWGLNPFAHYLTVGRAAGHEAVGKKPPSVALLGARKDDAGWQASSTMFSEHLQYATKGPYWEARNTEITIGKEPKAKVIAYYLPQFHAIPENNANWGLGFTEWRNIIRGLPRFRGHYQPRVPEELGFYDLTDANVLKRQAEMAKAAGIHAFCFYYYSFNGRRVLERPIETFLSEDEIDLQFALMWANENWTRTWDGLDAAVLLEQKYREEDEAALIADIARHFADPRYIRIEGRPIFFIYRPGQIPDAETAIARWRDIFKTTHNEVPLIFMCQGFDDHDPRPYGLDGAIEFPPHKVCAGLPALNHHLDIFDPEFSGHVVSYDETIERSVGEAAPSYPLIKAATPFWDNDARRPGRGMVLQGSTPSKYEGWLRQLISFSHRNPVFGEHFVAVNAWNEWAEGAYLEPDVYNGAAYLNATARAVTGTRQQPHTGASENHNKIYSKAKLAIVIHIYYPDVFKELLIYLNEYKETKIFLTTVPEKLGELKTILESVSFEYEIHVNENRGRDVAPFVNVLEKIVSDGFEYVLKLHTKKSTHRSDGDVWRKHMYDLLAEPVQLERIIEALDQRPDVGMVGPEGHVLRLRTYWGSNEAKVCELALRLGVRNLYVDNMRFVAGTMFVARVKAIEPLLKLQLGFKDFEPEQGQLDGTLAHAIERIFSISTTLQDMLICSVSTDPRNLLTNLVESDYSFVKPTHRLGPVPNDENLRSKT
ncbi:MAG: glycoside hydrolase family 99-like domain-containing protein [Beijerinckiaceae bacterium]|nr:glycoside hydrolase family 99-like domain-containing protein [Beijerinckiaceae bacterium]